MRAVRTALAPPKTVSANVHLRKASPRSCMQRMAIRCYHKECGGPVRLLICELVKSRITLTRSCPNVY